MPNIGFAVESGPQSVWALGFIAWSLFCSLLIILGLRYITNVSQNIGLKTIMHVKLSFGFVPCKNHNLEHKVNGTPRPKMQSG